MTIKRRLERLEQIARIAEKHTCGGIVLVEFGGEIPPLPRCALCERQGNVRIIEFADQHTSQELLGAV
jgi:hypothetical protein